MFNLPLGNPVGEAGGGLLIVRNQTEPGVVAMSRPALAQGWSSQCLPRSGVAAVGNSRQVSGGNFPPESPRKSPVVPSDVFCHSSEVSSAAMKNECDIGEPAPSSLDTTPAFDLPVAFPAPVKAGNSDVVGGRIGSGGESELPHGGGVCELCDEKSSLTSDVLDELLHIVNETLGPHTDTVDYDLQLDDDAGRLISMVVSPDSEVPACTAELAEITDYCPEWSYVEVLRSYLFNRA